jgi:hypothetical protein
MYGLYSIGGSQTETTTCSHELTSPLILHEDQNQTIRYTYRVTWNVSGLVLGIMMIPNILAIPLGIRYFMGTSFNLNSATPSYLLVSLGDSLGQLPAYLGSSHSLVQSRQLCRNRRIPLCDGLNGPRPQRVSRCMLPLHYVFICSQPSVRYLDIMPLISA